MFSFFKRTPSYDQEADRLLNLAKIISTSSTLLVFDACPAVQAITDQSGYSIERNWDFFFTTAAAATGMFIFADDRPSEFRDFATALTKSLKSWNSLAPAAVTDFQQFVNRNRDAGVDLAVAVGSWVIWNMKEGAPTDEEYAAAPVIGGHIFTGLRDWHRHK